MLWMQTRKLHPGRASAHGSDHPEGVHTPLLQLKHPKLKPGEGPEPRPQLSPR